MTVHLEVLEEELGSASHSCAVAARHQHAHGHQCIYTSAASHSLCDVHAVADFCHAYSSCINGEFSTENMTLFKHFVKGRLGVHQHMLSLVPTIVNWSSGQFLVHPSIHTSIQFFTESFLPVRIHSAANGLTHATGS